MSKRKEKKSFFTVLSEGREDSVFEASFWSAFKKFQNIHKNEAEVHFITVADDGFEQARTLFNVSRTPAFVISDEPKNFETGTNPFITFNRPVFEKLTSGKIFNLITDIHYLLIDENILRIEEKLTKTYLYTLFGEPWLDLKEFVFIMTSPQSFIPKEVEG